MPRHTENFLLIASAFVLLGMVLLQSACKGEKEDNPNSTLSFEEMFFRDLQGEWIFDSFTRRNHSNFNGIEVHFYNSKVCFSNIPYDSTVCYSISDPTIYTLSYIEKIQNWTITSHNDSLFLEIRELFGDINQYSMHYGSIIYYEGIDQGEWVLSPSTLSTDMKLTNQDTVIAFTSFSILLGSNTIGFATEDSSGFSNWTVLKPDK